MLSSVDAVGWARGLAARKAPFVAIQAAPKVSPIMFYPLLLRALKLVLLGAVLATPSFAQSNFTIEMETFDQACPRNASALITTTGGPVNWNNARNQSFVHSAAAPLADQCRTMTMVDLLEIAGDGRVTMHRFMYRLGGQNQRGADGLRQRFSGVLTNFRANAPQMALSRLDQVEIRKAIAASESGAENPLADRGYAASVLVHSEPGLKVYGGRSSTHPSRANRNWDFVFVHEVSGDEPMLLVDARADRPGGQTALYISPAEIERYQRILNAIGPSVVNRFQSLHFIEGFHHPKDDRRAVLETDKTETPILTVNRDVRWDQRYVLSSDQKLMWYAQNMGSPNAMNSLADARKAFPDWVPPQSASDPNVIATVTFDDIGLTLRQVKMTSSTGGDTYVLRVTGSTVSTPEPLTDAQFIGFNGASFFTLADLNDALPFVAQGSELILEFYTNRRFTVATTKTAPNTDRQVPDVRLKAPSDAYLSAQAELRAKAVQNGYVYKNENYWVDYIGDDVRDIIEGKAGFIKPASPLAYLALNQYVDQLQSAQCAGLLGTDFGVFTITEVTRTFDGYGNLVNTRSEQTGTVKVPRRFVEIYGLQNGIQDDRFTMSDVVFEAFNLGVQANSPGGLESMARDIQRRAQFIEEVREDIATMVRIEGCSGAVLDQFEENFDRYLNARKPLQQEPARISGASQKTDPVFEQGSARNLGVACLARGDFSSNNPEYCRCQGDYYESILTSEQAEIGLGNFQLLESLVRSGLFGRRNAYQDMRRRCVVR